MSTIPPMPYPYPHPRLPRKQTSGLAVASLTFGILGCVPFITGLLAVILGIFGIRQTRDPQVGGSGLAIAGLVLGLMSLTGWTLLSGAAYVGWKASQPARQVGEAFVYDLSRGRIDAAYAMTTNLDQAEFESEAAAVADEYGASQNVMLLGFFIASSPAGAECDLKGVVEFEKATRAAEVKLIKVGDEWKVTKFKFPESIE